MAATPKIHAISNKQTIRQNHEQEFNSIVLHMEKHNQEILENLKRFEDRIEPPLDNCVSMQLQLNRLKSLMETIFSANYQGTTQSQLMNNNGTSGGSSSLNEPSLIESTPVLRHNKKSELYLPLTRNFSPIMMRNNVLVSSSSKIGIKTNGTIRHSMRSKEVMTNTNPATVVDDIDAASGLPSLTDLSVRDLSSLLIKTGKPSDAPSWDLGVANITEKLAVAAEVEKEVDSMEEIESVMLRLESVFQSFHRREDFVDLGKRCDVRNLILDIGHQMKGFAYNFHLDHVAY